MNDIFFSRRLLKGAAPLLASLAVLTAAQTVPAAGSAASEGAQATTADSSSGSNAPPLTFEAVVFAQTGNDEFDQAAAAGSDDRDPPARQREFRGATSPKRPAGTSADDDRSRTG